MMKFDETAAVLQRLRRAKDPFFTRFGRRLTPIQVAVIPKILDCINVVVASPTASGKTESVVAPLAEQFVDYHWQDLAILYIVPTRALANDTLVRIKEPLGELEINCILKHGDKPHFPAGELPNCLITTPESLDSLIARQSSIFSYLQAVVLDEIHLLDNTSRGDQLRLLLRRLRSLTQNRSFAVHQLSATLSDPCGAASRYVDSFEIVTVKGIRDIEYHQFGCHEDIKALVRARKWRKTLYFCNTRRSVEVVAAELSSIWKPYPVVSHHGSLGRKGREEAETVMKEAPMAVCVATSTLEIGIDIGDIDLVVMAEVPWSISSLLQRIGRGSRRENIIQAASVLKNQKEQVILEAMLQIARTGFLPKFDYQPDKAVAVQQIFSCLYQFPIGVKEVDLTELLSPLCSNAEVGLILNYLQQKEWIERRMGYWCASTKLMDMGEKGQIHSNISNSQDFKVVDVDSGVEVGMIAGVFDDVFILGEKTWRVVSVLGNIIKVKHFKGTASAPFFKSHSNMSAFYHLLPPTLQAYGRAQHFQ